MREVKKDKKIKYHRSHVYVDNKGEKVTFITQLYQVGVYAIINNDPALQFNFNPSDIVNIEKKLKKALKNKEIKSLKFGFPITVTTDESGFWKEVDSK